MYGKFSSSEQADVDTITRVLLNAKLSNTSPGFTQEQAEAIACCIISAATKYGKQK